MEIVALAPATKPANGLIARTRVHVKRAPRRRAGNAVSENAAHSAIGVPAGIAIITFVTAKSAGGNGAAPMVTGATIVRVNPAMMPLAENLESACLTDAVDFSHE